MRIFRVVPAAIVIAAMILLAITGCQRANQPATDETSPIAASDAAHTKFT